MAAYLVDHPPRRSQYRHPRRAKPTGCIVLHSAENVPDLSPPDTGADAVAKFIVGRTDPGSYHVICDSDSAIQLVDFADEAFQDGTGSNPWAIAISGAYRVDQWETLPAAWRLGVIEQMAQAVFRANLWLTDVHGVSVPAVAISRAESDDGKAGFITHAKRDPGRRRDPGDECARLVIGRYAQLISGAPEPPEEETVQLIYVQKIGDPKVYLASVKTAPRHVKLFKDAEYHAALTGDAIAHPPGDPNAWKSVTDGEGQSRKVMQVADGTLYGI